MPVGYHPQKFWTVVFTLYGSAWHVTHVWVRAFTLLPVPIALALVHHFFPNIIVPSMTNKGTAWLVADLSLPFSVLVGLMTSFRLTDAFRKWERAAHLLLSMHQDARTIMAQLCSYLPSDDPHVVARVQQIRRLIVLGCVFIKYHVRGVKGDLKFELQHGLLTQSEQADLKAVCTVASGPMGDGKDDKYPSKNRPAFAFQEALRINHEFLREGRYVSPHPWVAVNSAITGMANTFEQCEHLGTTLLPLPYAQLTRSVTLLFLLVCVPLGTIQRLHWLSIPLCFLANVIYFLTDECASQMELPFGTDENDVDIDKMIRRIDKHTACQLAKFVGEPVSNFNLYPDTRTTGVEHDARRGSTKVMGFHSVASFEEKSSRNSCAQRLRRSKEEKPALLKDGAKMLMATRRLRANGEPAAPASPQTARSTSTGGSGSSLDGGSGSSLDGAIGGRGARRAEVSALLAAMAKPGAAKPPAPAPAPASGVGHARISDSPCATPTSSGFHTLSSLSTPSGRSQPAGSPRVRFSQDKADGATADVTEEGEAAAERRAEAVGALLVQNGDADPDAAEAGRRRRRTSQARSPRPTVVAVQNEHPRGASSPA